MEKPVVLAPTEMRGRYSATVGLIYESLPAALWWGNLGLAIVTAALMWWCRE